MRPTTTCRPFSTCVVLKDPYFNRTCFTLRYSKIIAVGLIMHVIHLSSSLVDVLAMSIFTTVYDKLKLTHVLTIGYTLIPL